MVWHLQPLQSQWTVLPLHPTATAAAQKGDLLENVEGPLLPTSGYHPADSAHGGHSSFLASSLEPGPTPKRTVTLLVALRYGHSLLGTGAPKWGYLESEKRPMTGETGGPLFRVGGLHVLLSETEQQETNGPDPGSMGSRSIETHFLPAREVGDAEGPRGSN